MKLRKDGKPRKIPIRQSLKQETKDAIAKSLSGRKVENPKTGFSHTKETKDKISASVKKSIPMRKRPSKISRWTLSKDIRDKLSSSAKSRWANMSIEEKDLLVSKIKNGNKWKESGPEIKFKLFLEEKHIEFEQQVHMLGYIIDFYIPSKNVIVEIHGCHWHGCDQCGFNKKWHIQKRKEDLVREETIRNAGYNLKIIWEHELKVTVPEIFQ